MVPRTRLALLQAAALETAEIEIKSAWTSRGYGIVIPIQLL